MTISIYILIALGIVAAEIIYDKWCWRQIPRKNDKPTSTILRYATGALAFIIIYLVTNDINYTLRCAGVIISTFFLTFGFSLNISRWKDLPNKYYAFYMHSYRRNIKDGFSKIQSADMAYAILTKKQKREYKIGIFIGKFFWHGKDKKKWSYDWIWNRIPPQGELLVKGIVFYMAAYWYFN